MMKLKGVPDANMPKQNSRKAAFACITVLAAGLMGCATSSPPQQTRTVCQSYGVPPRNPAQEELPDGYTEVETALLQPPYSTIRCVTVEER
ncbi:MAG: hypothetical protein PHF60_03950 [Candidatus ainarchaeum sp.]|nr:hypothetical protein [Candidatus ainarchaeum sp.]